MGRLAKANLTSKTARLKLEPDKYHFATVAPRVVLGYWRASEAPAAGRWVVRVELSRSETGSPERVRRTIGVADDLRPAHPYEEAKTLPIEARILDYASAVRVASDFDPDDVDSIPSPRSARMTVKEAGESYLADLRAKKGERAEHDARNKLSAHVFPTLGRTTVADLTTGQLRKWQAGLVRGDDEEAQRRSRSTANRILHTLKAMLNHAFHNDANGITTDKPWRSLKTFAGVGGAREHHFTEPEVQRLIEEARSQDPAFADMLEASFWTGARYSEINRLLVGNYDSRRRQLLFSKAITKTAKARAVLLVPEACEFFSRITRNRNKAEVLLLRSDGSAWGKSHQARRMKAALKAAHLDTRASLYALRHTVASRMIENGAPLTLVAEQLGTSPRMLAEQYAHLLAERERAIVNQTAPRLKGIKAGRHAA